MVIQSELETINLVGKTNTQIPKFAEEQRKEFFVFLQVDSTSSIVYENVDFAS